MKRAMTGNEDHAAGTFERSTLCAVSPGLSRGSLTGDADVSASREATLEGRKNFTERIIQTVLGKAGIVVDGNQPWDISVNDPRFYARVFCKGSLGLGESYMEGWWNCQGLDQFFERVLKNGNPLLAAINPIAISGFIRSRVMNLASKDKAFAIGQQHYDLGNDLFQAMLDPTTMSYSCGYWKDASTLDDAQTAKLDLICRKLQLRAGQRVLEIGCGWGGFARHAATHYNVEVVGLTVSKEQHTWARERCKALPVDIRLQDYRDTKEQFDHVVSIGMFEHVGPKNHRAYMEVVRTCLRPNGLFLLHTIGTPTQMFYTGDPWIRKYIFPVGELPTRRQIHKSAAGLFSIMDWHGFGTDYDPTLMSWYHRFTGAWEQLKANYNERAGGRFYRMWEYYLLACAGSFRTGNVDLWQLVMSHPGKHSDYGAVR